MRVVTFNIRYGSAADGPFAWEFRREGMRRLLLDLDADVYCFQEALEFQVHEIAGWLAGYSWVGVGRDDGIAEGEFAPIFYRGMTALSSGSFWLSATPKVPGSIGWTARLPRICTWAQFEGLLIGCVHLDHESDQARTEGVKVLLERIEGRALVCGDFNAEPTEPFFGSMIDAGFADLGAGTGCTYNDFTGEPQTRIDYVFGRGIGATSARVVRTPLVSDHWPVVVETE